VRTHRPFVERTIGLPNRQMSRITTYNRNRSRPRFAKILFCAFSVLGKFDGPGANLFARHAPHRAASVRVFLISFLISTTCLGESGDGSHLARDYMKFKLKLTFLHAKSRTRTFASVNRRYRPYQSSIIRPRACVITSQRGTSLRFRKVQARYETREREKGKRF